MSRDEARMPNTVLIGLRERAGLSQQDLADELTNLAATRYRKYPQITRKTIGRWERGEVVWPQPFYRRLLAQLFDCAADELALWPASTPGTAVTTTPFATTPHHACSRTGCASG